VEENWGGSEASFLSKFSLRGAVSLQIFTVGPVQKDGTDMNLQHIKIYVIMYVLLKGGLFYSVICVVHICESTSSPIPYVYFKIYKE
jgi:hypothetical protein